MRIYGIVAIVIGLAASACLFGCQNAKEKITEKAKQKVQEKTGFDVRDITPAELDKMKSEPDVQLVDVRTATEIKLGGGIEGAINIPVNEIEKRIGELDKTKKVIVYCRSGSRSKVASGLLVKNGFKKVYNLTGGYLEYKKAKGGK
jgi:rhodanese-related sulfurtransferase